MERIDEKYIADVLAVRDRIARLARRDDLATTAITMLEALLRKIHYTDDDLWFLAKIEERY